MAILINLFPQQRRLCGIVCGTHQTTHQLCMARLILGTGLGLEAGGVTFGACVGDKVPEPHGAAAGFGGRWGLGFVWRLLLVVGFPQAWLQSRGEGVAA